MSKTVTKYDGDVRKYIRIDWIALFSMILVFGTAYLMYQHNLQGFWLRGLFYTSCFVLFFAALIRIWRVEMGAGRQLLFVIAGAAVAVGMMTENVQSWISQQTQFQLYPFGLVSTSTNTVVADNLLLMAILIVALGLVIVNLPKIKAELS